MQKNPRKCAETRYFTTGIAVLMATGDDRQLAIIIAIPDLERDTLYCVSPLAEINGDSSVLIPELAFLELVDWTSS